jgi:Mrp family chromosome partitioning ATPase
MTIWEDVYAKNKVAENVAQEERVDKMLSDSLDLGSKPPGHATFEDMYYRNTGRHALSPAYPAEDQPVAPPQQPPDQEPAAVKPAAVKKEEKKTIPPAGLGRLTTPYPASLAKIRHSLSDTWANMLVENKREIETVLVCGAARREGVTFIAYHLAMFLSKEYRLKVLYIDTNLQHTPIPALANRPGLFSFVSEQKELPGLVIPSPYPGLFLLPSGAGRVPKNVTSGMLSREPLTKIVEYGRQNFAITIFDGQPITASAVMIELARLVDSTLLVCRYGQSRQEVSKLAVDKLQKFGVSSLGVILNDRKFPIPASLYRLLG